MKDSEKLRKVQETLAAADSHTKELRDAWERGALSERDGLGGTRSNRNVDVEVAVRNVLPLLPGLIRDAERRESEQVPGELKVVGGPFRCGITKEEIRSAAEMIAGIGQDQVD